MKIIFYRDSLKIAPLEGNNWKLQSNNMNTMEY